jgi:hypothetical protein
MSCPTHIDHRSQAPAAFGNIQAFPDKLYVVTCISNPVRYHARYRHYHTFEKHMKDSGAILYTIEMAYANRPFEITTPCNPNHIQVRADDELWHKENLLNIAINRLPPEAKYIAWIDADINFARPDWAQETLQQLQHYDFLQLFSQAVDLGPKHEIMHTARSWTDSIKGGLTFKHANSEKNDLGSSYCVQGSGLVRGAWHSGFAWAARRSALDAVGGLMDIAILGSADRHMAAGLFGFMQDTILPDFTEDYKKHLLQWQERAERKIRRNVGQVEGTIFHHFHGKKVDRRYVSRWQILLKNQFNPVTDIKRNAHGLWQLHDDGSPRYISLRNDLRDYFRARNEDSIDI